MVTSVFQSCNLVWISMEKYVLQLIVCCSFLPVFPLDLGGSHFDLVPLFEVLASVIAG
jgi:hypothetical protein